MNPGTESSEDLQRLAEASAWRVSLAEADLATSAEFEAWIARHPDNAEAWARVSKTWDFFSQHATAPEIMQVRQTALERARRQHRRRIAGEPSRRTALAAGLVLAVAAGSGVLLWRRQGEQIYRTDLGERRSVVLADGSRASLDSASELHFVFSRGSRELVLERGQARFDVARDVDRPFRVVAGEHRVIAIGTQFNVDLIGDRPVVTLIEGRVAVETAPSPSPMGQAGGRIVAELAPGDQFSVQTDGAARITRVDPTKVVAWQSGQIIFDDEPLSAAAERVSRYGTPPVHVEGAARTLRVSGVFNAGDTSTFVDTVCRALSLRATKSADGAYSLQASG